MSGRLRPLARHRLAGLGGYEPVAIPRLRELIMKLGFAHASAAGDGRRQEAMA
jgi:hypothetical protein